MKKHLDKFYIIVPAYNEEENIKQFINEWYPIIETYGGEESKLVIVDDGSSDRTYELVQEYAKTRPYLDLLRKPNGGHGSAVLFGYRYAIDNSAEYIFQTDSDGQTSAEEFEVFWRDRNEYSAIIGNRVDRQDGKSRKFVEYVLLMILKLIFKVNMPDANAPFRLMKVEVVKKYLPLMPVDFNLPNVMLSTFFIYYGEKVKFVPIFFGKRCGGRNSINWKGIIRIGWNAIGDFRTIREKMN